MRVKALYGVHVTKIPVTGLAISRPSWDFQNRQWSKDSMRGIILGIRSMWGIISTPGVKYSRNNPGGKYSSIQYYPWGKIFQHPVVPLGWNILASRSNPGVKYSSIQYYPWGKTFQHTVVPLGWNLPAFSIIPWGKIFHHPVASLGWNIPASSSIPGSKYSGIQQYPRVKYSSIQLYTLGKIFQHPLNIIIILNLQAFSIMRYLLNLRKNACLHWGLSCGRYLL